MLPITVDRRYEVLDKTKKFGPDPMVKMPGVNGTEDHRLLDKMLSDLSHKSSWGVRQNAARKLGTMGDSAAVSGLLIALPADPFWMVRYAIIQALEKIGDPRAIPALKRVEKDDAFLTVRSNAAKAIETLSRI
jgi:HEAT repeat protein